MDCNLVKEQCSCYLDKCLSLSVIGSEVASSAPASRSIAAISWFSDLVLSSNEISKGVKPSEFWAFVSTLQFNKRLTICFG